MHHIVISYLGEILYLATETCQQWVTELFVFQNLEMFMAHVGRETCAMITSGNITF